MSEDEHQGRPAAEQTVARLFEAAGYEVSKAVRRALEGSAKRAKGAA